MDTPKTYAKLQIVIKIPKNFGAFAEIKSLSGRRWNRVEKVWTAPLTVENCDKLEKAGVPLSADIHHWLAEQIRDTFRNTRNVARLFD